MLYASVFIRVFKKKKSYSTVIKGGRIAWLVPVRESFENIEGIIKSRDEVLK